MADRTFLRGIFWIYEYQRHTGYSGLVGYKLSKLCKAPRMVIASLRFTNRSPLSDSPKIFEGDQERDVFSLRNQHLRDLVISISRKSCRFARQLLKMPLGTFGSCTLEPSLETVRSCSGILDRLARMYFAVAIYCQIFDTKINTKNPNGIIRRCFGDFDHNAKIENSFDQDQVGLTSNPIHPGFLILSKTNGDQLPTLKGSNGNMFQALPGKNSFVVDNRSVEPEFWFDRFVSFVSLADLGYSPNGKLRRESKMLSDRVVDRLMDLNLVGTMQSKNRLCYLITGLVKPLHSFAKHLILLWRGVELNHQGLKHYIEQVVQWVYSYRTRLLPTLKEGVSAAEVLK